MGVATAVAIGGLAISAASTTMSFVQAGKQKKAKEKQKQKQQQQWQKLVKNLKLILRIKWL
jgi:hypothetical protein